MGYTVLDFAEDVLLASKKPLTFQEIWEKGVEHNFEKKLNLSGKTPSQTLGARLYVDVRDNLDSRFVKVGKNPARFFLKERKDEISETLVAKIERNEQKRGRDVTGFLERELHPLLTYFVYANPSFSRGRNIHTKTIFHEKSKKQGYNEWLHPDLVGFYIPLDDWNNELIKFNKLSDKNVLKLFSFELKKFINKNNYRESYFQAVSNSSWANEGYLVTAGIKEDDDLLSELERLTMSFGIGIINLDLDDFDGSSVLFPAKIRTNLDWETMNKLCEQNPDFMEFIENVGIDFQAGKIRKPDYDEIIEDPVTYIQKVIRKKGDQ